MQRNPITARATGVALAALTISCVLGSTAPSAQAATISPATLFVTGAGSTFINPLMSKWTFAYSSQVAKNIRINYQSVGSGAGVAALTSGTVDFAASDAFLTDAQLATLKGNALHIPLTIGPVAVLANLPGVAHLKLDGTTLAQIYLGKITAWNDAAIAKINAGVNLPNTPIVVVHRSDGSGTSFIFTNFLSNVDSDWKSNVGAGTAVNWPTGQGGKGTPGVAQIVSRTPGALGYAELSYSLTSGLPVATIKNNDGMYVVPTAAGSAACAAGVKSIPSDLRALLVACTGADTYPITGFSWAIVYKNITANQVSKYQALLKFLWWATHDGQKNFPTAGLLRYAPLPANIVKADEAQIKAVTYNGKQVYQG